MAYNLTDRMVVRSGFGVYYDNLNLNELQFTRLIPPYYGQYSLNPPVTAPLQVDTLFPDLNNIPQFPAPFSMDPTQPLGVHDAVERELPAEPWARLPGRGRLHGQREPEPAQALQHQPGGLRDHADQLASAVPAVPTGDALLVGRPAGRTSRACRCASRSATPPGLFFLANYQLSENRDNGSGEVEANDTAFRTDLDADASLSRYHQRHRGAFSFGYELPFGEGRRLLSSGGPVAYVLGGWQVQGVVRAGSGFPFTLSGTNVCQCGSFVPQRVNYCAGT